MGPAPSSSSSSIFFFFLDWRAEFTLCAQTKFVFALKWMKCASCPTRGVEWRHGGRHSVSSVSRPSQLEGNSRRWLDEVWRAACFTSTFLTSAKKEVGVCAESRTRMLNRLKHWHKSSVKSCWVHLRLVTEQQLCIRNDMHNRNGNDFDNGGKTCYLFKQEGQSPSFSHARKWNLWCFYLPY